MVTLRPYERHDRDALYEVCLRTGADGGDATAEYLVPTLLGEVYLGPYLEFAPDLAWSAVLDGRPLGYVLGVADTTAFEAQCDAEWWPTLRERYPLDSFAAGTHDTKVVELIHHPATADATIVREYPAHLHIDLTLELQGRGLGPRMIVVLLEAMKERGVRGVHLGVSPTNIRAIGFYQHLGFHILDSDDPHTAYMGIRL